MALRLTLAAGSSLAAIVFLLLGITRYPITDEQRFMRFVFGPPPGVIPVWWQLAFGLAFAVFAFLCLYRIARR